jgi:ureidoacrylate peracid hydrolase
VALDVALDPNRTALLVVDMQNDFCAPGGFFEQVGLDISPGERIVEPIARLLETARSLGVHVVFTRSMRPDPQPQRLRPSRPFYKLPVEGARPFAPGTWGSEIVDALPPAPGELVLDKPRYSAFYETALTDDLRARGVDTVALAGTTTNCCIDSTMRDAYYRDFNVVVLSDCVAGFGGEERLHESALENCRLLFGVVATSGELVDSLQRTAAPARVGA